MLLTVSAVTRSSDVEARLKLNKDGGRMVLDGVGMRSIRQNYFVIG